MLGLEIGLFPIGKAMAEAFAFKGSLFWLLAFGFGLGFSTTIAEPALIAVTKQAAAVAANAGFISTDSASGKTYAFGLRLAVAFSVGVAIVVGLIRILKGWPVHYYNRRLPCCYDYLTSLAPEKLWALPTIPAALLLNRHGPAGDGPRGWLAGPFRGRNPLIDGFGLIAFSSLLPMIFVMAYGMVIFR